MNKKELKKIQMSESIFVGVLLAFSGGLMDAYTYVFRGGVFANAQTGNLILLGINVFDGSFHNALKYLFPVLSFTCGVLLAQVFRLAFQKSGRFHWRHLSLFLEIVLLTAVSLMSTDNNLPANCMVSFACGIQVQSFQKIRGNHLATTMCIGNLRTATDLLANAVHEKNAHLFRRSCLYYGVIVVFSVGAVCGNALVRAFGQYAILASPILLLVAFGVMCIEAKEDNLENHKEKF